MQSQTSGNLIILERSLAGISCLVYNIIPPPLQDLSSLNGAEKPFILKFDNGNESSNFVSDIKRKSIFPIITK